MPIDDPTTALQALNLSDERQRSPLSRFAKPFLAFTKLIAPPGGELTLGGLEAAVDWLGGKAELAQSHVLVTSACQRGATAIWD